MLINLIPSIFEVKFIDLLVQTWVFFDFLKAIGQWLQSEVITEVALVRLSALVGEAVAMLDVGQ